MRRLRERRAATGIFAVALVVRVLVVLVLPPQQAVYPDTLHYDQIARHLLAGDGYVDDAGDRANRLPAYPLFLAAHRVLFGDANRPIQLTQALLGAAACLLLWRLARRTVGAGPGLAAAGVAALYPLLVVAPALLIIETPFSFLLLLELLLLRRAAEDGRPATALAAGVAGGAATMIQAAHGLLFAFLLPLAGGVAQRKRTAVLLAFTAGTFLLPAIWTVRNALVLDAFVPFSTRTGFALDVSFRPGALEGEGWLERDLRAGREETAYDPTLREKGVEFARQSVMRSMKLAVVKQQRLWNLVPNHPGYRAGEFATLTLPFLPVFLFFLIGLVRLPRTNPAALWLLVPILYVAAVYLVYVGSIRYRLAIEPLLIAVAAAGAWDVGRAWRERRRRRADAREDTAPITAV